MHKPNKFGCELFLPSLLNPYKIERRGMQHGKKEYLGVLHKRTIS